MASWMLPTKALNMIRERLPRRSTILELGSGEGTVELGKDYNIFSIEHNIDYCANLKSICYHVPLSMGWYDRDMLEIVLPSIPEYDLLIIDGPPGNVSNRSNFMNHLDLFDISCNILIDDIHRPDEGKLFMNLLFKGGRDAIIQTAGDGRVFAWIRAVGNETN